MIRTAVTQSVTKVRDASVMFKEASAASNKTLSIHRWTNWIAGFSGDFAHSAIRKYLPSPKRGALVLDPFAGVGTTLVEANRQGIDCVGFEINPFAALVSRTKLKAAGIDVVGLQAAIARYAEFMEAPERAQCLEPRSVAPLGFRSRIPFFSKSVERLVLHTIDYIEGLPQPSQDVFRVALASVLVEFSNYTYEPSLGSRPGAGKPLIDLAPVGQIVSKKLGHMFEDTLLLQSEAQRRLRQPSSHVCGESYFESDRYINAGSVDLVVTSPPYMNNYHYVRNTRPQLYWSALVTGNSDLKRLEEENFGKFWQTVRGREDVPLGFELPDLERQISEIRLKNADRGVYGGRGWANYMTVYMNDLHHLTSLLSHQLRPRTGIAVIVIGNSVIQGTHIPVEQYLSQIAGMVGLKTEDIVVLRSRTGSSIVNSGTRLSGEQKYGLYDFAVVIRR